MKTKKYNGGHYPDYLREAFVEAVEAFYNWDGDSQEQPTVSFSYVSNYNEVIERTVTLSKICGLLWNCTDILPGSDFETLKWCGIEPKSKTYAAAAHALSEEISGYRQRAEFELITDPQIIDKLNNLKPQRAAGL